MMTREKFINLLGLLPDKTRPASIVIDEVDCGSYLRRTIEYAVEPGERIRAFLCLPHERSARLPAIYCFHQHAGNRLLGKVLHDMSAGIDVLQGMAEVDAGRIGFIGHSYGGRLALFAPVFDRRIKVSVCNCGSTNYRDMPGIQFDFVLPGILRHGDIEDIVRLIEPASVLILGGDQDKWSKGIEAMVDYAQSAFRRGVLDSGVYSGGHQFTFEMHERAYGFLGKRFELEYAIF